MKILIPLLLISFQIFATVVVTNHSGKVKVNDLEISKKTPVQDGYKLFVPSDQDSFAVIAFKGGNRILVKSGEVIFESIEELDAKLSIKYGEVYFHVVNPDKRLITTVLDIKTKSSVFNVYGGDSYLNLKDSRIFYAVVKGKTTYQDPWGKLTASKSQTISRIEENKAPVINPILYKTWKKIKIGFERMGINFTR